MASTNTNQQQSACEFVNKCEYSAGCFCKGIKENQCVVLSVRPNLLEVNRVERPHCTAAVFFGFSTTFCRCMQRREKANHATPADKGRR